jgi:plasmid stability protein
MPNMTVRNIDVNVYERLKDRARANRRSLEAETRDILAAAVKPTKAEFVAWCRSLHARQKVPKDWDSTAMIRADRDRDY